MALTREERKLLHRKSQQATFGIGKPNDNDGFNGDISYRKIEGSGTVQYLKEDDSWKAISSSGEMPPLRVVGAGGTTITSLTNHGSLSSLSNDDHTQYLLVSGTRAMTGNLSLGGNNIGSVGTLDVDGATTLDKTTINTTDGAFLVSGTNSITLTTTSSDSNGNLDINVGFNYDLDVARACDWNTGSIDWDNSGAFNLTTLSDATIETLGTTSSPRTLSLTGGLSDFSKYGLVAISSFIKKTEDGDTTDNQGANGIHIKCDAGNVAGKHNNIFIEQKNQSTKGSGYGINLKSSNGVKIETSNNLTSQPTAIIMEAPANGTIDIGLGSVSPNASPNRIKVHGVFEISNLYRPSDGTSDTSDIITTDIGTGFNGTASGEHVQFQAINTFNLLRAMTHKATGSSIANGSYVSIVNGDDDDNQLGTVWRVTVFYKLASNSSTSYFQIAHCYASTSSALNVVLVLHYQNETSILGGGDTSAITWESGAATGSDPKGIKWVNGTGSSVSTFRASALKIQGASDF